VYLRRGLFWWIVVVPALSLLIAFIADRVAVIGLILFVILLIAIPSAIVVIYFALLEDVPPGVLWMLVLCPLVLATTSLLVGMGGYAVLRGERVDAVVDKVSKRPAESSPFCTMNGGCVRVSSEASMRIDQLSDPATKEVIDLGRAPGFSRPDNLLNDGRSSYGKYEAGDRVPALVVRGSDHPAVTVGNTSHVTFGAVTWLGAWLIGLVCVVVSLWPEGQRRRISGSRT